jgi:hypothetical protein
VTIIDFPATTRTTPDGCVTTFDLCQAADITFRQADYWTRTGYLHEHPRPADAGSGIPRYFPTTQVPLARLAGRLVDAGVLPRQAFDLANQILEHGHAHLAGIRIELPQDL